MLQFVSVTDRQGRRLNQSMPFGLRNSQSLIGNLKRDFMERYGPDCYTFVNEVRS
jgi:hypothetical protein